MRSVQDWFDSYGGDHQHPTNRLIHWICVPAILWSVIAALWLLPKIWRLFRRAVGRLRPRRERPDARGVPQ